MCSSSGADNGIFKSNLSNVDTSIKFGMNTLSTLLFLKKTRATQNSRWLPVFKMAAIKDLK